LKIYLDMDGVLADFDRALLERGIVNETQFIHKPKEEWSDKEIELDRLVVACMDEPNWFYNLKPFKGAVDLVREAAGISKVGILTARPKNQDTAKRVKDEKKKWIEENIEEPLNLKLEFHCCVRHQKQDYAASCTRLSNGVYDCTEQGLIPNVLVDDLQANVREWEKAGGIGILFENSEQAINDLKKVFDAR